MQHFPTSQRGASHGDGAQVCWYGAAGCHARPCHARERDVLIGGSPWLWWLWPTTAPRTGGSMRMPALRWPRAALPQRAVGRVERRRRHGQPVTPVSSSAWSASASASSRPSRVSPARGSDSVSWRSVMAANPPSGTASSAERCQCRRFGEFAHLAPTEVVSGGTPSAKSTPVKASISLLAASQWRPRWRVCERHPGQGGGDQRTPDRRRTGLPGRREADAVNAAVDIELPSTVVFDYPVGAMSGFIVSQMHPEGEAGTEIVDQPSWKGPSEQRNTGGGRLASRTARRLRADSALDVIPRVPSRGGARRLTILRMSRRALGVCR